MYSMMTAYNLFSKGKRKERFEIILEPLQAMIQISFLGFYPIGSKLNIHNNLLYIQAAGWSQPLSRAYYNDSKDDLFYLFNAVVRFNKFYKNMPEIQNNSLFNLLKKLCIKGIDNLIVTYNQVDNPALLHTLRMYKMFLESDLNSNLNNNSNNPTSNNTNHIYENSNAIVQSNSNNLIVNSNYNNNNSNNGNNNDLANLINTSFISDTKDIDDVFVNITKLYSIQDYNIIYSTLILLEKNPQNYNEYITGINSILNPINSQIKKWINDNIVF
tara:strand:- start:34899 stop:35714 length:816 start_codon:yes stop_codon:yes gene_type:complete